MKSFRQHISEALLPVDRADVDLIFKKLAPVCADLEAAWDVADNPELSTMSDSVKDAAIQAALSRAMAKHTGSGFVYSKKPVAVLSSADLKSELAKKAHEINPIKIEVYYVLGPNDANHYNTLANRIRIGIPFKIWSVMVHQLRVVSPSQRPYLRNEISALRMLSTIRHELSHWIDDSLHNLHLKKSFQQFNKFQDDMASGKIDSEKLKKVQTRIVNKGKSDIYLSHIEVTAMVNQIDEVRDRLGEDVYNRLSWGDLLVRVPTLSGLDARYGEKFRRIIFTRMSREGLLTPKIARG